MGFVLSSAPREVWWCRDHGAAAVHIVLEDPQLRTTGSLS